MRKIGYRGGQESDSRTVFSILWKKKKRFSVRISRLIIEIFDSTFENFVWKFIFISHGFMKRNIVRGRIFLCRRFFFFVSDEDFTRFYLFTG